MSHITVTTERHTFTKSERGYVKSIVHCLSFQRLTDQEIVQWLHDEKQINLERSTVSKMRNQIEKQAEKWYIELKQSRYKYIAIYKERLYSLYSYQNKLNEIVAFYLPQHIYPETVMRAISELHSIEMSIFNIWKQLPDLQITDRNDNRSNKSQSEREQEEDLWGLEKEPWDTDKWVQCSHSCCRWFRKDVIADHESKCVPNIE